MYERTLAASPGRIMAFNESGRYSDSVKVKGKFRKHHAVQSITSHVVSTNSVSKFSSFMPRRCWGTDSKMKSCIMSKATPRRARAIFTGLLDLEALLSSKAHNRFVCNGFVSISVNDSLRICLEESSPYPKETCLWVRLAGRLTFASMFS